MKRRARHRGAWAVAGALLLGLAACGDDEPAATPSTETEGGSRSTTTAAAADRFPPQDVEALRATFDPLLEPLGVHLTRGVVVDRTDGWEPSPTGTHLALYVEPLDDDAYTTEDYVDGIYEVARAVVPEVFEPWPGLETFDICQEPYQAEDDRYEPFPRTQVELTRDQAAAFDWEGGDLTSFLRLLHTDEGARLVADRQIEGSYAYRHALEEAGVEPDA